MKCGILQAPGSFLPTVLECFQSSNLIGWAVTHSQSSLGVKASFRLGFRAGYVIIILISTNQIRALKITPG